MSKCEEMLHAQGRKFDLMEHTVKPHFLEYLFRGKRVTTTIYARVQDEGFWRYWPNFEIVTDLKLKAKLDSAYNKINQGPA